ncbi:hypothetical protein ACOME3_010519 [Neoechinorhynchus agilis]
MKVEDNGGIGDFLSVSQTRSLPIKKFSPSRIPSLFASGERFRNLNLHATLLSIFANKNAAFRRSAIDLVFYAQPNVIFEFLVKYYTEVHGKREFELKSAPWSTNKRYFENIHFLSNSRPKNPPGNISSKHFIFI